MKFSIFLLGCMFLIPLQSCGQDKNIDFAETQYDMALDHYNMILDTLSNQNSVLQTKVEAHLSPKQANDYTIMAKMIDEQNNRIDSVITLFKDIPLHTQDKRSAFQVLIKDKNWEDIIQRQEELMAQFVKSDFAQYLVGSEKLFASHQNTEVGKYILSTDIINLHSIKVMNATVKKSILYAILTVNDVD